jgi:probable rRNA maturation factor
MTRQPHAPRAAARAPNRRRPRDGRSRDARPGPAGRATPPEPDGLEISNRQTHVRIGAAYIRKVARAVLDAEEVASARISVALADNATVRRINREYLTHDYDTDVLSFLFESVSDPKEGTAPRSRGMAQPRKTARPRGFGRRIDGEVLASAEMAVQMAERFGWSPRDELTLYLVHGLLHLCGYDDLSPHERRIMRDRERAVLATLGIAVPAGLERAGSRRAATRRRARRRAPLSNGRGP